MVAEDNTSHYILGQTLKTLQSLVSLSPCYISLSLSNSLKRFYTKHDTQIALIKQIFNSVNIRKYHGYNVGFQVENTDCWLWTPSLPTMRSRVVTSSLQSKATQPLPNIIQKNMSYLDYLLEVCTWKKKELKDLGRTKFAYLVVLS